FNTHANGLSPGPLWTAMMFGHVMVTAFWAGGLVALLLIVFPSGDPQRVWPAVSRFSNLMTVTLGLIVVSGLVLLFRLLSGNIKGMWCSDFGLVAGFKMAVVGIAMVIGAINNRVVAYQKRSMEAPVNKFRPRKERSLHSLRKLIVIEAFVLGGAVLLSGALGETQLPSVFKGHFFPADLQETVRPGLFASGCQSRMPMRSTGAVALLALCASGLVACSHGSSAPSPPKVAAPAVARAAAFRVVYKVDDTAGPELQVSTDVLQVQEPWNARLEHRDGPPPGGA